MYQLTGEDPRPIVYLFYPNRIEGYNLYITLTTGFFLYAVRFYPRLILLNERSESLLM